MNSDPESNSDDARRGLPSVSRLLEEEHAARLVEGHSREAVVGALRETLEFYRHEMGAGGAAASIEKILDRTEASLEREEGERLRPVVNASGIILHTGLGRAVLPKRAVQALSLLDRCCNLQLDLETGRRGKRNYITERLLCRITGAEAAMVVTNNAAATLLILTVFSRGREVIVSRGQLIEIGGSFRLPDCIHQSGAIMREVGTTNKTHLRDYENAMTPETAILFRCNPSNYRIVGFTKSVSTRDLATIKNREPWSVFNSDLIVVDDLGCGALIDLTQYGLPKEPTVQDSLSAGADLVCFSGDKLIGGPQAGIIVGRVDLIRQLKKHPLTRMLRVGKLTDMALQETLRLFLEPDVLVRENPTLRMLSTSASSLRRKALTLKKNVDRWWCGFGGNTPIEIEVVKSHSAAGGGSLPDTAIDTWALAVISSSCASERISYFLRRHEPPVIGRIESERVLLDMRTLLPGEEKIVADALVAVAERIVSESEKESP
ncbi:L-seryl-tRNA(Sec) selenium transferase [bacterium]|nr:L-seryl-tRNA(Sec) selenium transferase [bacterium]